MFMSIHLWFQKTTHGIMLRSRSRPHGPRCSGFVIESSALSCPATPKVSWATRSTKAMAAFLLYTGPRRAGWPETWRGLSGLWRIDTMLTYEKIMGYVGLALCLGMLCGCPPLKPADAIPETSPIVGRWEGSITLADETQKDGIVLEFAATSLETVGMFGGQSWVTWASLYEDDHFEGHVHYDFDNDVASIDDWLSVADVVFGPMTATLTLSGDGSALSGPISYDGSSGPVTGTLNASKTAS